MGKVPSARSHSRQTLSLKAERPRLKSPAPKQEQAASKDWRAMLGRNPENHAPLMRRVADDLFRGGRSDLTLCLLSTRITVARQCWILTRLPPMLQPRHDSTTP